MTPEELLKRLAVLLLKDDVWVETFDPEDVVIKIELLDELRAYLPTPTPDGVHQMELGEDVE
jgi:hypothetical protein